MRIVERLERFTGAWTGVNRLRLLPTDDFRESPATAKVAVTAAAYVTVAYTWVEGDEPQNGLILLGGVPDGDDVSAVWVDSWHAAPAWMTFAGAVDAAGVVRLTGSYPAPSGPDWGWLIDIDPGRGEGGRITMYNVVPGEEPYSAVEIALDRPA